MKPTTPANPSGPPVAVEDDEAPSEHRRSFFAAAAAILAGSIAVLTPIGVGVASFLTPLFRKSQSARVRVALLDQAPDDGVPRYFPVVAPRDDAWTHYSDQRIGAVYLIRNKGEEKPRAFTAKCPHAGCCIGYTPGDTVFKCPCHTSTFNLDGSRARGDAEVAPRGMDALPVEIRPQKTPDGTVLSEVFVTFFDFKTGIKEQEKAT